ncbi:MAG: hypothetical protein WD231_04165 [Candidatus Woykebacteria bacterium]
MALKVNRQGPGASITMGGLTVVFAEPEKKGALEVGGGIVFEGNGLRCEHVVEVSCTTQPDIVRQLLERFEQLRKVVAVIIETTARGTRIAVAPMPATG